MIHVHDSYPLMKFVSVLKRVQAVICRLHDACHSVFSEISYMIFSQIPETLLQNTLKFLVDVVNSETASLASVAMQALGHIALRVPLPLLTNDSSSGNN